jgi:hypothetical protein
MGRERGREKGKESTTLLSHTARVEETGQSLLNHMRRMMHACDEEEDACTSDEEEGTCMKKLANARARPLEASISTKSRLRLNL